MLHLHRRDFLAATAAGLVLPQFATAADKADREPIAFLHVGDTHFLADKAAPQRLDPRSAAITGRFVEMLNALPGSAIPAEAGGGTVRTPHGVIHSGDCIDSGDKPQKTMQDTEWSAFADAFGLTGRDGRLKFPVYEVHGNHDSPRGDGLAIERIIARNKQRPGVNHVSENGVHYSWDWGPVHFIHLGIVVGQSTKPERRRRYAPLDSLAFLIEDLRERVGDSGRPVVITHHIDMLRYAKPLPIEDAKATGMEWDPADVHAFYQALHGYTIAAILYGHTHARNVFRWDGTSAAAETGIPAFNVDNSSHFAGPQQACFYIEIANNAVTAREYFTKDAWQTAAWTPQVWKSTFGV